MAKGPTTSHQQMQRQGGSCWHVGGQQATLHSCWGWGIPTYSKNTTHVLVPAMQVQALKAHHVTHMAQHRGEGQHSMWGHAAVTVCSRSIEWCGAPRGSTPQMPVIALDAVADIISGCKSACFHAVEHSLARVGQLHGKPTAVVR